MKVFRSALVNKLVLWRWRLKTATCRIPLQIVDIVLMRPPEWLRHPFVSLYRLLWKPVQRCYTCRRKAPLSNGVMRFPAWFCSQECCDEMEAWKK